MVAVNKEKKRRVISNNSNKPGLVSLFSSIAPSPSKPGDKKDSLRKNSEDINLKNKLPVKYIKPAYLQREKSPSDYKLTDGIPPLAITCHETNFYKGKTKSCWEWQGFNPATRNDNLVLHSWKKKIDEQVDKPKNVDHHVQLAIPTFTDEIYEQELKSDDWTLEETRHLFELCQRFDLRFLVINDRFITHQKQRSLEDLKERFYQVSNALSNLQKRTPEKLDPSAVLPTINFDKVREKERKDHLEKLYFRNPDIIDEEESLVIMIRKLRHCGRSYIRQREHLLQVLNVPPPSSVPSNNFSNLIKDTKPLVLSTDDSRPLSQQLNKKKRKPVKNTATPVVAASEIDASTLATDPKEKVKSPNTINSPSFMTLPAPPLTKAAPKENKKVVIPKIEETLTGGEVQSPISLKKDKAPIGAHLRSSRFVFTDPTLQEAFVEKLLECDFNPRPFMPSESVYSRFEEVQKLFLEINDLKEQIDGLEKPKIHSVKIPSRRPSSHTTQNVGTPSSSAEINLKRAALATSQSREKKKHRDNGE